MILISKTNNVFMRKFMTFGQSEYMGEKFVKG